MYLQRILCSTVAVVLLSLALGQAAQAQNGVATDEVYFPGYAAVGGVSLAAFVPQSLRPACAALQNGDLASAEKAFAEEMRHRPGDMAAVIGYLQAARSHRDALLGPYLQEETASHSPAAHFKLGVLAFYMFGARRQHGQAETAKQPEVLRLKTIAAANLQSALDRAQDPVVGFLVADAAAYIKLSLPGGSDLGLYEAMLKQFGGSTVYHEYLTAKSNDWDVPQPPLPKMPPAKLRALRYIIGGIRSENGGIRGTVTQRVVDGRVVYDTKYSTYTPAQERAMAYLGEWGHRLAAAAGQS